MKIPSSHSPDMLALDSTNGIVGLNGDKIFSEEQANNVALKLLRKASDIVGALEHESTYVDCGFPESLSNEWIMIIRDIDILCMTLKGSGEFLPLRGKESSEAKHGTICVQMLRTLASLIIVNSSLALRGVENPRITKASVLVTQSAALVSRAVEVYRYRRTVGEGMVEQCRRCTSTLAPQDTKHVPVMVVLINALTDAIDTIIVDLEDREVSRHGASTTQYTPQIKEALLSAYAAFVCASRCISEDIIPQQTTMSFTRSKTPLESQYRSLAILVLRHALKYVDYVVAHMKHNKHGAGIFNHVVSLEMASNAIEIAMSEIETQKSNIMGRTFAALSSDVATVLYSLLSGVCCMRLMRSICKKHNLDQHPYHKSLEKALDLAANVLGEASDKFCDVTGKTSRRYYTFILQNLEVAQESLQAHSIPAPLDEEQFNDLTGRALYAIDLVCAMCAESIKEIDSYTANLEVPSSEFSSCSTRGVVVNTQRYASNG